MLYQLLRPAVVFATRQFFREILITGETPVRSGPLLIVANHPNVMLDGLLVIRSYPQSMWFVAKSTIFRGAIIGFILSRLHLIPIKRRVDFEGGDLNNEDTFKQVAARIAGGGSVLIFPEGKSLAGRKIQPVKTGAARIAFRAEQEAEYALGLQIQVVGITYSDFYRLQSSVTVRLEEPIAVKDYLEQFHGDSRAAVGELSKEIEIRLKRASAEVASEHYEKLISKIAKLYQSKGTELDDRGRIKLVAREVERLGPKHPEKTKEIERRIDQYLHLSSALRLDGSRALDVQLNSILLILLAPFLLLGVAVHLIPYLFIANVVHRRALHRSQLASYQIAVAFILFPLWYFAIGYLTTRYSGSTYLGVAAGFSVAICGYLSKNYLHQLFLMAFSLFWPAKYSPVYVLRQMRDDLLSELEALRTDR